MNPTKIWKKITVNIDGTVHNLRFTDLPKDRIDDFVDFQMNYYVRDETSYKISGLPDNMEAMAEYREIFKNIISDPSCHNIICTVERQNGLSDNIVATMVNKLIKRGDPHEDYLLKSANSEEILKLFKIARDWNSLYPIPYLMKKYDLPRFFDILGLSVHPDYRKCGIATEFLNLTRETCKEYDVPMIGSWMTSLGTQKAAARNGWETEYEISGDELAKTLNVTLESTQSTYKYMINRI